MSDRCDTSAVQRGRVCVVECGRVGWEIAQGTNASVADKVGGSAQVTSN